MIALLGPIWIPEGATGGSPWPAVLLLIVFLAAVALVVAWDRIPWTPRPVAKEQVPESTYQKAA